MMMHVRFLRDDSYCLNGSTITRSLKGDEVYLPSFLAQPFINAKVCESLDAPFKVEAPALTLETRAVDIETKELPAYEPLLEDVFKWSKSALKALKAEGITVARIAAMQEGDDDYRFVIGLRGPNEKNIASIIKAAQ